MSGSATAAEAQAQASTQAQQTGNEQTQSPDPAQTKEQVLAAAADAAKVKFACEWNVYETGTGVSREEFARNPNAASKKSSLKTREKIATFEDMLGFAKFYNAYPKPAAFFQTRETTRHTMRENDDLVAQVKDIVVIRSHITVQFEDPAFCDPSTGKVIGHLMRINRINSAEELNAIWSALLVRMVGETLLPEGHGNPNKQVIACIRAKDMTNKKKQSKFIPNYRLELWLCNGTGLDGVLQSEVEKIVDEASRDSSTRDMMRLEFIPMLGKPASWDGGNNKKSHWR